MLDTVNQALIEYEASWRTLIASRANKSFFSGLKAVAVGWKVADRAEYDKLCVELHDQADQIIETWMNGRWVVKFHLRDAKLSNGVEIIKIMQRRPDSTDAIGLDHVDFYSPAVANGEASVSVEPDLQWSKEHNDIISGYDWLSIWFDGYEAKLKNNTVLDIIQLQLADLNKRIIS